MDYLLSRQIKKARRTAGDLTLNSTTWANVDTGLDMTLQRCEPGDQLLYGISARTGNEAVTIFLDVVTVVAGSPVNSFAKRGVVEGSPGTVIPGLRVDSGAAFLFPISGFAPLYTVTGGDISNDWSVTLRLRYATATAANRTLSASTTSPLDVFCINLGALQPDTFVV